MKREGRQHGLVRSYRILPEPFNPRPASRSINRFDSPPTAGLFTKVSPKPTNHSKFTGKCARPRCAGCHIHPASKSKDKVKGTHKLRSSDVVSNHRLVTWRVADVKPGLKLSGFSATGILDHLASADYCTDEDVDDDNDDDCVDEVYEESCELAHNDGSEVPSGAVEMEDGDDDNCEDVDEENDGMSFCDVALLWERADEDEGWCLVGEM